MSYYYTNTKRQAERIAKVATALGGENTIKRSVDAFGHRIESTVLGSSVLRDIDEHLQGGCTVAGLSKAHVSCL